MGTVLTWLWLAGMNRGVHGEVGRRDRAAPPLTRRASTTNAGERGRRCQGGGSGERRRLVRDDEVWYPTIRSR